VITFRTWKRWDQRRLGKIFGYKTYKWMYHSIRLDYMIWDWVSYIPQDHAAVGLGTTKLGQTSTNSPCPRWIWWGSSGRRQWLGLKLVGDIFHSFPLKSTGELSFSHPCPIFRPKNHTSLAAALTLRLGRATSSINLFGAIRDAGSEKLLGSTSSIMGHTFESCVTRIVLKDDDLLCKQSRNHIL
jgi:hypothetical protein